MNRELKKAEESRRERHWDAAARWRMLQDAITWAESQVTGRRNDRHARLAEQARKLAWLESFLARRTACPESATNLPSTARLAALPLD